jgi:PDZ domain-containing protein
VRLRSTLKRAVGYGAVLCLAGALGASAQNDQDIPVQDNSAGSQQAIPAKPPSSMPGMAHQGNDDATLEISPQTGIRPPSGTSADIPSNRDFRPGEDDTSIDRSYRPGQQDLNPNPNGGGGHIGNSTSCLGIQVKYTDYCFKGAEEHGLEVTSIDRNSPAEQAGLKATGDKGGLIAAAETASALLGPVQLLTNHFMEKAAMANRGDLIVAIDDQRVRSAADFNDAMAKARPGDTLYLTVIRPLSGGSHATMKIAVKVGKWQPGNADSCAAMTTASAQPSAPE